MLALPATVANRQILDNGHFFAWLGDVQPPQFLPSARSTVAAFLARGMGTDLLLRYCQST